MGFVECSWRDLFWAKDLFLAGCLQIARQQDVGQLLLIGCEQLLRGSSYDPQLLKLAREAQFRVENAAGGVSRGVWQAGVY